MKWILLFCVLISTAAFCQTDQVDNDVYSPQQNQIKTYDSYAAYAEAVRNAPNRFYEFPKERPATGKNVFIYDPKQLSWAAYDKAGHLVRMGPGSGGSNYCSDIGFGCRTPTGVFEVYAKQNLNYRSKVFPLPFGGSPMPYAMFFAGNIAIHGSPEVLEYNASHGCIRVLMEDAKWLNHFLTYNSTVIIKPY
jgi:hypothetical protein